MKQEHSICMEEDEAGKSMMIMIMMMMAAEVRPMYQHMKEVAAAATVVAGGPWSWSWVPGSLGIVGSSHGCGDRFDRSFMQLCAPLWPGSPKHPP